MPDEYELARRQTDQTRTHFAAIESDLEFLMERISRLPTASDPMARGRADRSDRGRSRHRGDRGSLALLPHMRLDLSRFAALTLRRGVSATLMLIAAVLIGVIFWLVENDAADRSDAVANTPPIPRDRCYP